MQPPKAIISGKEYTLFEAFTIYANEKQYTPYEDYVRLAMQHFWLTEEEAKVFIDNRQKQQ